MNVYEPSKTQVIYNYRYFLPYAPEWGKKNFCTRRLEELLEFCDAARIDAVQFYVNTRPGTYYMPASSADEQRHWARWMKKTVAPTLRSKGISHQLNYQQLLGSGSDGLDLRDEYDWKFMKNQHGEEAFGAPCPIDPDFRRIMGEMLRLWADTKPDLIWIDDDFRLHNHGMGQNGPDYYCYCDTHLNTFAERSGRRFSRESKKTGFRSAASNGLNRKNAPYFEVIILPFITMGRRGSGAP